MVNRVTLIGNTGKDPEIRTLENGAKVARFSVATDEGYKDTSGNWVDRTEWHDVVGWRGLAERAERSLKKGMLVYVEGKLSTRKWQDQDGNDKYRTEVVANYFRILNSREAGSEHENKTGGGAVHAASAAIAPSVPDASDSEDDDLPF
ncbi:MAG: single-stranded DNA-binding protein [Saprospiraceae bacterium]|nr:single-stranded DNA-binding protein [Saprospiraceae bacterium]